MNKSAPDFRRSQGSRSRRTSSLNRLAVLMLALPFLAHAAGTPAGTAVEMVRVPNGKGFEARFMPFKSANPLQSYGGMGQAPWITLEYADSGRGKAYLDASSLRLHAALPRESATEPRSGRLGHEKLPIAAQDVRALWTYRTRLTGWLNFDNVTAALHKRLAERGALPAGTHVTALVEGTYAEIRTDAGGVTNVALKTAQGKPIAPETPAPTWVEPMFHQVFIACVDASGPVLPHVQAAILGNRHESKRRCGLMNAQGRWLAKPEFEFLEFNNSSMATRYAVNGPYLLLLRDNEPCIATLDLPVVVACLGKPLSALFSSDRLAFAAVDSDSSRRGGSAIGYLAPDGSWAISPAFNNAQPFSGNIATVERAGVPGIIDPAGRWLTPRLPDDPVVARWLVTRGVGPEHAYGSGVINRDGVAVIPTLFPSVEAIDKTHFRACHQNGCDTVEVPDLPTLPAVKPIKAAISAAMIESTSHWIAAAENGKWGFQDAEGRWAIKPQFDDAEPFDGGLAKARRGELWGIVMPSGKWLFLPQFQQIGPFAHGVAVGTGNAGTVLLRADGKSIHLEGEVLTPFGADGLAVAGRASAGKIGFIDRNGEWAVPPTYDAAQSFSGAYAIVSGHLPETWRPSNFNEPPYILRSVHWLSPDVVALRAWIGKEERVGLIDKNGNWLLPSP